MCVRTQRKNHHGSLFFWHKALPIGAREHTPCGFGPSARIATVLSFFLQSSTYLLAQGHFGREGEGTFGGKKNGPKARKTKELVANAMHKAKYGRALNETGTAQLRCQAAHSAGASECN